MKSDRKDLKKLTIAKETLSSVAGAAWHRTTNRCHNTYIDNSYCCQTTYSFCTCAETTCYCSYLVGC